MSADVQNELASFHQFIGQKIGSQQTELSPEEVLELWREQNPCPEDEAETVEAVRESLADLAAGEQGVTVEEFDREFRRRHNIQPSK